MGVLQIKSCMNEMSDLKPNTKFQNPTIISSGRKVSVGEKREKKERKNAFNSGHLVPWQRMQAARTNKIKISGVGI